MNMIRETRESVVPTSDRWAARVVFVLVAVSLGGSLYVYDSIGPVADLLQRQRAFSDSQLGMLNAIYSVPNVVMLVIGGILIDRFGSARVAVWMATICLLGAMLTAWAPDFATMAAGRLLSGMGAETLGIAVLAAIARYFAGGYIAFAMSACVAIGRAGSFAADMSPTWFARAYQHGWQSPLIIAAGISCISFVAALGYWWLDKAHQARARSGEPAAAPPFVAAEILRFTKPYWFLLTLCVLWYAVMIAFRSTFSIKYFQHAHGLDLANAGVMNSYVFLAAMFATPAFGWISDRVHRHAALLAFGALLLPIAIACMAWTNLSLWFSTALIGVSFSLVPAVLWPLVSKLVPASRFGTAMGLMWVMQNAGIVVANLFAGWLNDASGAGQSNPAGYQPMMVFFATASGLGFCFALMLWMLGRRSRWSSAEPLRA